MMYDTLFESMVPKEQLREDIDRFFNAAMSSVCHCYDHTKGFYPDDCECDSTKRIHESMALLIEERQRLLRKYGL